MRVLCVCRRGNSRSVALAWLLKKKYKMEAVAVGIRQHPPESIKVFYEWADVIILVDERFIPEIPIEYHGKLKVWHVGTDIWFKGFDKGLIEKYEGYIGEWNKGNDNQPLRPNS